MKFIPLNFRYILQTRGCLRLVPPRAPPEPRCVPPARRSRLPASPSSQHPGSQQRLPRANPQPLRLTWPPGLQTSQPLRAREEPRERRGPGAPGPGSAAAREGAGPQLREGGAGLGRPPRGPGTGTGRDNSLSRAPLSARPRACRLLGEAAVGRGRSRQGPTVLLLPLVGVGRRGREKLHAEGRPGAPGARG